MMRRSTESVTGRRQGSVGAPSSASEEGSETCGTCSTEGAAAAGPDFSAAALPLVLRPSMGAAALSSGPARGLLLLRGLEGQAGRGWAEAGEVVLLGRRAQALSLPPEKARKPPVMLWRAAKAG